MSKPNLRINFGDKSIPVESKETKAKQQIERAKQNGLAEVDAFTKAYEAFKEEVKDLVLYKDSLVQIEHSVEVLGDNVIKPILLGKEVYGVSEHTYKNLRLDIFKSLIEKYEGGNKK